MAATVHSRRAQANARCVRWCTQARAGLRRHYDVAYVTKAFLSARGAQLGRSARPEAARKESAPRYEQQRRGPAPEPWQREEPPCEQAPAPRRPGEPARERRRRGGWGLGLAVVVGLCIVAALLAGMVLVAREQVLRSQAPPVTAPMAVQPVR
ncbi:hypothetical protein GY14_12460 [Delftia tsuruhatensis]|nr:hypothetical protein GY14_12460 [Delftia tsuruhatensis]